MFLAGIVLAVAADLPSIQEAVLADARLRAGAGRGDVHLVLSQPVTWPDASLGCPEPGRMYTQSLVSGYLLRVQAGAALLEYHAGAGGRWLYCPADRATAPRGDLT